MASANAFQFRMGAGFPGDINRSHPFSAEPNLNDGTLPVLLTGLACIRSATGTVRSIQVGDTSIAGVVTRPFPTQAVSGSNYGAVGFGPAAPPPNAPIDVLNWGYIIVQVNSNGAGIVNGSPVYVWAAASSGAHVQGGFEGTNPAGNGFAVTGAYFRGPVDTSGYTEVMIPVGGAL